MKKAETTGTNTCAKQRKKGTIKITSHTEDLGVTHLKNRQGEKRPRVSINSIIFLIDEQKNMRVMQHAVNQLN